MKAEINLGNKIKLEIEERSEMETLHKAVVLSNPPTKCDECGNIKISLDSNKDKEGNIYINIKCVVCGAKAKLGQYKSGGYFWHKFEKWVRKEEEQKEKSPASTDREMPQDDEVPF